MCVTGAPVVGDRIDVAAIEAEFDSRDAVTTSSNERNNNTTVTTSSISSTTSTVSKRASPSQAGTYSDSGEIPMRQFNPQLQTSDTTPEEENEVRIHKRRTIRFGMGRENSATDAYALSNTG